MLLLGMDVGGTSTRTLVSDVDGRVVGTGLAGGGNPVACGAAGIAAIRSSLRDALADVDPGQVAAGVYGLAGGDVAVQDPAIVAALAETWQQAGLRCTPVMVADATLAFVSGTPARDGSALIAGTGSVAAAIHDRATTQTADGHGWLLGDDGSGFWLGREAVRTTVRRADRRDPLTSLNHAVLRNLAVLATTAPELTNATIAAVHALRPVDLARLAPLVLAEAAAGEPDALAITDRAAALLVDTLRAVRPAGATTPIVLSGGLLTGEHPLADAVRTHCATTWPAADRHTAGPTAAAAAWLASRQLPDPPAALYRALVAPRD
jgi:N-acetylglucosamine kinase-like BadF-type ATPase